MPEINDKLVLDRLVPVIETLREECGESLEPEDVISTFNEFGLFIIDAEAWVENGSTETDLHND